MAVSNAVNLPCRYLTENAQNNFREYDRSASIYRTLFKVSYVAIAILATVFFTLLHTGTAMSGAVPLLCFWGSVFLGLTVHAQGMKFHKKSEYHKLVAEDEKQVTIELKKIEGWKTPQIEEFLHEQGLVSEQIPMEHLQQLSPEEPLCALLPLIARFNAMKALANKINDAAQKLFAHPTTESRNKGHILFEGQALPTALNAAVMLQMIQNPRMDIEVKHPDQNHTHEFSGIGRCKAKYYDQRMFERTLPPIDDDYLVFEPKWNRPPLTRAEIEENMDPRVLRLKIFVDAPPLAGGEDVHDGADVIG